MSGTTTLELPRRAGSASIARLVMSAHCADLGADRLKSANLMVSELVSNACKHGSGRIQLTVRSDAAGIHAEVSDEGTGAVIAPADPRPARGGWGLYFVDRLSDSWGVGHDASRVWFQLA